MPSAMPAQQVLNREFLEIRAKILELAASFDRLDRGEGSVQEDARMRRIHEALQTLQASGGNRAEQVQMIFSRAYETSWREEMGV